MAPCNCRQSRPYSSTTPVTKTQYVIRNTDGTHYFDTLQEAEAYKAENGGGVITRQN